MRTNQAMTFTATVDGSLVAGGAWNVLGGAAHGTITRTGIYTSPSEVPSPNTVTVTYTVDGQTFSGQISIMNPSPSIRAVAPQVVKTTTTALTLSGEGFVPGSLIVVDDVPVTTAYIDASHLSATVTVPQGSTVPLKLAISNPDPGAVVSTPFSEPVSTIPAFMVEPAVLHGGPVTITVTGLAFPSDSVLTLDGKALTTTVQSDTKVSATGYLPPWKTGTSVVGLSSAINASVNAGMPVAIAPTAVTYEAAARFLKQAGFGPRHDLTEHVQQIGFDAFLQEQVEAPAIDYPRDGFAPYHYLHYATEGSSVLKLRVAWALQQFIATQGIFVQQSTDPIERKFERDSVTNFRQLLGDIASDTSTAIFLNLANNYASQDPSVHPNQNFARELLQLFTLGPVLLNEDGTPQSGNSGQPIATYDQATILDLSRVFTGWTTGRPVDTYYTFNGVDYSQPLAAIEGQHDHGQKVLFGSSFIPAGQTATQDREMALDAIFAHPNLPPFISKTLIQRLVKSNPTPAYIERVSTVFKDNGHGVRGDMAAIVRAILLDKEARSGDTTSSADDGVLQDPLLFETFAMSVSGATATDGQLQYMPGKLGEPFWYSETVFAYFSPSYVIPGTGVNSPEFQLFNNISAVQRSDALWGMINGGPGFAVNNSAWLYKTFPDVPSLLDALDHLVYYGRMPVANKAAIAEYCNSLDQSDPSIPLRSAMFLALNSDSYNVNQ